MKRIFIFIFWAFLSTLIAQNTDKQDSEFSISPKVDQLITEVASKPEDVNLRINLSNAYLEAFNPELALIELIDVEKISPDNPRVSRLKGIALIQLEQFSAALRSLQDAYIMAGDDTSLKYLAITDFALGHKSRGSRVISALMKKYTELPDQLYNAYKQYFVNNRFGAATAAHEILAGFAPEKLKEYFPDPNISIISPDGRLATESESVAIIFEVNHIHPIRDVQVGGQSIFQLDPSRVALKDIAFKRTFSHKISLNDGFNSIPISVTDIYQKSIADTILIDALYFKRPFAWSNDFSDSLFRQTALLKSYTPADLLQNNDKTYRLMVCGSVSAIDSLKFSNRALFFYDWLTNDMWGKTNTEQAKLVINNRFKAANLYPLFENWLYKQSNVQTKNLLYFGGKWDLQPGQWNLNTFDDQRIDVKKIIEKLSGLAAARTIFFIDGWGAVDTTEQKELQSLIESSPVPMAAVLLNDMSRDFNVDASQIFAAMPDSVRQRSPKDTVDLSNINLYLPTQKVIANQQALSWEIVCDPKIKVYSRFIEMYSGMIKKMDREKIRGPKRKLIKQFYSDWIRIGEIRKYLLEEWTFDDFYIRAEEYYQRNKEVSVE